MDPAVTATYVAGAAAAFVGTVQALIYNSQRRIQDQANKQALFDRRIRAYLDVKEFVENYVEREGLVGNSQARSAYNEALKHVPFIFSERARKGFRSVELRLKEHEEAMPPREYDVYGDVMKALGPEPAGELAKLKSSLKALPVEVETDLRLT
jgi:hypothetical protein